MKHLGIDLSSGVAIPNYLLQLQQNAKLDFAVWRLGGSGWTLDNNATQVLACKTLNIPFGIYFYLWPTVSARAHVANLLYGLSKLTSMPSFLAIDIEEHPNGLTGDQLSDMYQAITKALQPQVSIPFLIYTGNWFVEGYSKKMATWIKDYIIWEANYKEWDKDNNSGFNPTTNLGRPLSWSQFNQKFAQTKYPVYDASYPIPMKFHQLAGDYLTPMVPKQVDYSQMEDDLYQYLFKKGTLPSWAPGYIADPVPTPEPQPIPEPLPETAQKFTLNPGVEFLSINTGPGPSSQYKTSGHYVKVGDTVSVLEFQGVWGKIIYDGITGWINTSVRYCVPVG